MTRYQLRALALAVTLALAGGPACYAQAPNYFVETPKEAAPQQDAEPLPPDINVIADVEAKLKVIQRPSQLIVGKTPIVRTAVADPSIVDVVQFSPQEVSVIGLTVGSTTVTFWFDGNPDPLVYLVEVIRDPSLEDRQRADYGRLERKLALIFPNSKVYLIPLSGKIIVKGQARDSEEATRILDVVRGEAINQNGGLAFGNNDYGGGGIGGGGGGAGIGLNGLNGFNATDLLSSFVINMLEIPGEFQIHLRVRVAEIKREMLRRMGVDLGYALNNRQFFNSAMGGGGGNLTGVFESGDINVALDWLAANGTAKILAEPNITVLSGHTASFLAGGEFPVPTIASVGGVAGQQTSFRGFGVSLFVIPEVIDHDMVRMQIMPEFSSLDAANGSNGVPGTNVRRVQTTVEMREGQTIALAGLLSHQTRVEVTRVPWLGEIPYVGMLFSAKKATIDESELLILVTPELVRPMEADEVPPVPGHEVTHPNDLDLYRYNRTEGTPDQSVNQIPPYGHNGGIGQEVGYTHFNPAPAQPNYNPGLGQGGAGGGYGMPQGSPSVNGGFVAPQGGYPQGRTPVNPPTRSVFGIQPQQPTPVRTAVPQVPYNAPKTSSMGRPQANSGPKLPVQRTSFSMPGKSYR